MLDARWDANSPNLILGEHVIIIIGIFENSYFYVNKEHNFVSVLLLRTDKKLTFTERVSNQYIMCVNSSIYGQYTMYMSLAACHVWRVF